jgi:hypothetical protein
MMQGAQTRKNRGENEDHVMFVYGTLRRGFENHFLLDGAISPGAARTRGEYALYFGKHSLCQQDKRDIDGCRGSLPGRFSHPGTYRPAGGPPELVRKGNELSYSPGWFDCFGLDLLLYRSARNSGGIRELRRCGSDTGRTECVSCREYRRRSTGWKEGGIAPRAQVCGKTGIMVWEAAPGSSGGTAGFTTKSTKQSDSLPMSLW